MPNQLKRSIEKTMRLYHNLSQIDMFSTPSVITVGMFDGVHLGHLSVLTKVVEISKRQNIPSIVLTFTNHPSLYFNKESNYMSLSSFQEKAQIMEDIGIDILIALPFDQFMASLTAQQFANSILIALLQVKHIVFGYDNHFGQNREGSEEFIHVNFPQIETYRVKETIIDNEVVSSSLIKQYLLLGRVNQVTKLLGHSYNLTGLVIKGDQLGRTIGFPTANLQVNESSKLIPAKGVYVTRNTIMGKMYYGMTNIGVRPTVSNSLEQRIETHLFDFDKDIYGEELRVDFIYWLRNEIKYDSFSALVEQLEKDRKDATTYLTQIHVAS
jgi:riboflavin kinase/FMN adenylyltransferase